MDVNTRIDRMDEELKLIKNEIKQVLLEIQEHVLAVQNPFTAVVTRGRPDAAADSAADSAPVPQRAAVDAATADPPAPQADAPAIIQQAAAPPQPVGAPNVGFPFAPQVPSPPPAYPAYQTQAPPPPPPPPPPPTAHTVPVEKADPEPEALPDHSRDEPAGPPAKENGRPSPREKREIDMSVDLLRSLDADEIKRPRDEPEDSQTADEDDEPTAALGFGDELESHEPGASAEDSDETAGADEAAEHPRRSAARRAGAGPIKPQTKTRLDLATLASLVQWTHRVVQDTGPDYAATLFEISEMTGHLSSDLQRVLLAVVQLLSTETSGSTDFATKAVTLLAQLDGLMGNTTQEDARLLPFLLRGDLEVLSLIRR